jgi:hypothetical protein
MTFLSGCVSDDMEYQDEKLVLYDKTYEICDSDWYPYGTELSVDDYVFYENDTEKIFVKVPDELFSEGVLYHSIDDEYPDVTQTDKIEKIDLVYQNKTITLNNDCISEFSELLSTDDIESSKLKKADMSSEFVYVNVYYSNYPAYQNELLICKTEDGEFGIMFCETEQNTATFGSGMALTITSNRLTQCLEQIPVCRKDKRN